MNLNVNNLGARGVGSVNEGSQTNLVSRMFADAKRESSESRGKPVVSSGGQRYPNPQVASDAQVRNDTGSAH